MMNEAKSPAPKTEVITFRTDPATHDRIADVAMIHDWTIAFTVDRLIRNYFFLLDQEVPDDE